MSHLQYKTKGNTTPKGKPKVYLCCHPDDLDIYLDGISEELFSEQNCSVWYTRVAPDVRNDDFLEDLCQMQLFVIPVTLKFLNTSNVALEKEFKFALKNNIPVLPIMQESGLETLFNQKCGDIQFLDKTLRDKTAIRYQEKLKSFLSSVLIGDELANKVRAAFDAYVFLSYRKKDRKYAQELMKLIHKNDFCRNVAIWYDEFLTPGENFNDAIESALKKSGLFVLAVTPNIVNETNYIMTTEYPMALREDKPILPAELIPTDRQELLRKYEKLPLCANAHSEELTEALLASIKRIVIKENDSSPEHNFFIGLAYLTGIDVEVDYDRAIQLITKAAESGLYEAKSKLVDIYSIGVGIKLDIVQALAWQKNVLENLHIESDATQEELEVYVKELLRAADLCQEVNQIKEATKYMVMALDLTEQLNTSEQKFKKVADIYNDLAIVARKNNQNNKSLEFYKASIERRIKLAQINFEEYAEALIESCNNVAYFYDSIGLYEDAEHWYMSAIRGIESFDKKNLSLDVALLLGVYCNMGTFYFDQKRYRDGEKYYNLAYNLSSQISLTNNFDVMSIILYSCFDMGNDYYKKGDNNKAKKALKLSLDTGKKLYELNHPCITNSMMARIYYLLGLVTNDSSIECLDNEYFKHALSFAKLSPKRKTCQKIISALEVQ